MAANKRLAAFALAASGQRNAGEIRRTWRRAKGMLSATAKVEMMRECRENGRMNTRRWIARR